MTRAWYRLALLACSACWTATRPAADDRAKEPTGTCVIRDRGVKPMSTVALSIDGQIFANLDDAVEQIELTVRGAQAAEAAARVATDDVELAGQLALAPFHLRPRGNALHDGWLAIEEAAVTGARGNVASVAVPLPAGLAPKQVVIEVSCDQLTAIEATHLTRDLADYAMIKRGTPLLKMPGAKQVAQILGPDERGDDGPVYVEVLERKEGMLRVRATGPNAAYGWVAATATEESPGGGGIGHGGGGQGVSAREVKCSTGLPLFVRSKTRGEVLVGKLKPNRSLVVVGRPGPRDPVEVQLHGDIHPYVRADDLAACPK